MLNMLTNTVLYKSHPFPHTHLYTNIIKGYYSAHKGFDSGSSVHKIQNKEPLTASCQYQFDNSILINLHLLQMITCYKFQANHKTIRKQHLRPGLGGCPALFIYSDHHLKMNILYRSGMPSAAGLWTNTDSLALVPSDTNKLRIPAQDYNDISGYP